MTQNTYRAPVALAIVALFAASLAPVSGAVSPISHAFAFGPGEPEWTVIELDVLQDDSRLRFTPGAFRIECPMVLSFSLVRGNLEETATRVGLAFQYASDATSVQVEGLGVEQAVSLDDAASNCEDTLINWGFSGIPAGHYYLVAYHAGNPVTGMVAMQSEGSVRMLGIATGDTSFYLKAGDFVGAARAGVSMPSPPTQQVAGGAEVGLLRSASFTFEDRPWFVFGTTAAGVNHAHVTDPVGLNHTLATPITTATVAGVNVGALGAVYGTRGFGGNPSGTYEFVIDANVDAGTVVSPGRWEAFGADIRLPNDP